LQAWDHFLRLYATRGAALNVNDLLRDYRKADLDDFIKGHWDSMEIPGSKLRAAMPATTNMGVVFFNRAAFRRAGVPEPAAGWTYDDYAERAKRLTRTQDGQQQFGVYHPTSEGAGGVRTQNHVWAFGGHWVDPKDLTKLALHEPAAQQGLDWLYDRYWKDSSWIQVKQRPSGWQWWVAFCNGSVAMGEDGVAPRLIDFATMEGLDFGMVLPPKGPGARLSWLSNPSWIIWKETRSKPAAWELAKFLSGPEFLKLQTRALLFMPPRVSLLDDWIQTLRQRYPALAKVNLKLVQDAATAAQPPLKAFEFFLCQGDVAPVVMPLLAQVYGEGTARPSLFRDYKDQIERAANGCGASLK
jgi:multiple sugar transport system substrate-binding protein